MGDIFTYGRVVGRFINVVGDDLDEDELPNVEPLSGTILLTPMISSVHLKNMDPVPATAVASPITVELDGEGYLTRNGVRRVTLIATDNPELSPSDFTWQVSFSGLRQKNGSLVSYQPFNFKLAAGTTADLTLVAPVPASGGTALIPDAGIVDQAIQAAEIRLRAYVDAHAGGGGGGAGEVPAARTISVGPGLNGGGDLSADRLIELSTATLQALGSATTAYQKPANGIPGADFSASIRASLGLADTAVQPGALDAAVALRVPKTRTVTAGTGLTGGGDLSEDRSVTLSPASVTSLGRADSAVQPARAVATGTGLQGGGNLSADRSISLTPAAVASLGKADTAVQPAALATKADLVGGFVPTSQLPALALNTSVPVASQAEMLALTAAQVQPGDLALRADGAGTFMLMADDPSVLSSWRELPSKTAVVQSVNGQVGVVVLGKADVGLGNVSNLAPADLPVSTATQTELAKKSATGHKHVAADLTDATDVGKAVVTASTAALARQAIGAGTGNSNLELGTTSTTAKRGDYAPAAADISDASDTGKAVIRATTQALARQALGITGTGADGATGPTGPQGPAGNVVLLPVGVTVTPTTTPGGTLVLVRA